ncbi:MAG: zinc transport system ATP-binding protein [Clostridium sp.]|jgi:zinc transport system ATP-binding protein
MINSNKITTSNRMTNGNKIRSINCNKCSYGLCCTKIQDFGVTIGKAEILKDINLHIHCGDLTAIIGANGAGKSTLIKALLGGIPHSGHITFVDGNKKLVRKLKMGYVPQKLDFDYSSPVSVLDMFSATLSSRPVWVSISKNTRKKALESLSLVDGEYLIDKRLGVLSGGELQRVLLALALQPIPDILLLDEPVSGIDQNGLKLFYKTVSNLRKDYDLSIILVSHDLPLVSKYADRIAFINNKTIECCGTTEEVFSNEKVIDVFGVDWNKVLINKNEEDDD